jgi:hypothetical protein
MFNPLDDAAHIIVLNVALLDAFVDAGTLVKMGPDTGGLHDGAEVRSFKLV